MVLTKMRTYSTNNLTICRDDEEVDTPKPQKIIQSTQHNVGELTNQPVTDTIYIAGNFSI